MTSGKASATSRRFSAESTRSITPPSSSSACRTASATPVSTSASHTTKPQTVKTGRTSATVRSRKASGSKSGKRIASGLRSRAIRDCRA
ncbi:hypothetical protein R2601_02758 [Salipiger bermudensis HTCC2601]|uniref:Uncharacterized protein n=1 Tax=Salipiger bermudensis (strain DSM 26914 / JCM 13377 / KCTC 12554 / HTCC2601) TaxID=314265 RepID=Q0FWU4_SALBH|nr:hypothetical protein R2601_02758 [Salipiger bermudensis HTCC2601]